MLAAFLDARAGQVLDYGHLFADLLGGGSDVLYQLAMFFMSAVTEIKPSHIHAVFYQLFQDRLFFGGWTDGTDYLCAGGHII